MKSVTFTLPIALVLAACSKAPPPSSSVPSPPASAAAASLAPPPPSTPFEGEIVVTVTDAMSRKLPSSFVYDIKGNKVAYVPAATTLRAIGDLDAQRIYAINDAERTYEPLDLAPRTGEKIESTPSIYKTSTKETIAGMGCEDMSVGDGAEKVEVCASAAMVYVDLAAAARSGRAEPAWATALTNAKMFPLRVIVRDQSGREKYRAEATKVERKRIDDSAFQVPSGYKQGNLERETKTASLP